MVRMFIQLCDTIKFPVSMEKTEWASLSIVFLGIMLDGHRFQLSVPLEKRNRAINMIRHFLVKKKAKICEIQGLAGLLNFMNKAIFPGRVFTRRMYAEFEGCIIKKGNNIVTRTGKTLRPYHHINLNSEFRFDCKVWEIFLSDLSMVNRPMVDLEGLASAVDLDFYSDASLNHRLGFGCRFKNFWTFGRWEFNFIKKYKPSIAYLELYAMCVGIFTWAEKLTNIRMVVFIDNKSARDMINSTSSNCKHCMKLLRLLTLNNLMYNRRVFARYVESKANELADDLSRMKIGSFFRAARRLNKKVNAEPDPLPNELWPLSKLWEN